VKPVEQPEVNQTSSSTSTGKGEKTLSLPDQLKDLYQNSLNELNDKQQTTLKHLLYEYQDVFAKDDFDLWNFTEIEYSIEPV